MLGQSTAGESDRSPRPAVEFEDAHVTLGVGLAYRLQPDLQRHAAIDLDLRPG